MIVHQYGLTYKRIDKNDLELIRYWRNQSFIRDTMQYKEYITPQMQLEWFERINNPYNYYFLISENEKKIGLINNKPASLDINIAEGGLFFWDKSYWGTAIPVMASLTVLQAVFEVFKSGTASIATVAKDNSKAIDFNKMLGYEIEGDAVNPGFIIMKLTCEKYFEKTIKLKRAAEIYSGGKSTFEIQATPGELYIQQINDYLIRHSVSQGKQ